MLNYKNYKGYVVYDDEAEIFHGEVVGLNAVITFQGTTVTEIKKAFKDSIDDYLEWCKERGTSPEKSFSGKFNLRMTPDLYTKVYIEAAQKGMSINSYIIKKLKAA